jgi:hypothetical protein
MKSGLPSSIDARSGAACCATMARVRGEMMLPSVASSCAAASGCLPPASVVAKAIRRLNASGLSQAASVFLYPSGQHAGGGHVFDVAGARAETEAVENVGCLLFGRVRRSVRRLQ